MAETFNPIISHLYCGQGGTSTEVTKYNNETISEINVVDNGVTTKYDFGYKYIEKMYSGDRVWNQYTDCTNPSSLSQTGNVISSKLFTFNTDHKYLFIFDGSFQTSYTGVRFSVGIWNNAMTTFKRHIINADSLSKRYAFVTDGISALDDGSGTLSDFSSVKVAIQVIDPSETIVSASNKATVSNVQCIDITLVYGVGNEPTTVAEFAHDYPELYYPYNAGTDFSLATKLFNTIKQPLDSIKFYGNTMRWCQLVHNGDFSEGLNYWGEPTYGSFAVANGKGVYTVTTVGDDYQNRITTASTITIFKKDHKYLVCCTVTPPQNKSYVIRTLAYGDNQYILPITSLGTASSRTFLAAIVTASADGTTQLRYTMGSDSKAVGDVVTFENCQYFDLTYIFGAGNEPTTVSDFTRRLKKPYYPFTNGEILSIEKASGYLYGLNIWDEEWEVGGIDSTTGANDNSIDSLIRSKNYTMVLPSTEYFATIADKNARIFFYDGNKNFLSYYDRTGNGTFTVPSNACYIRFRMNTAYGTTYNNDICINLSDSSINGTYEASKGEQKMQLDSFNVWDEEWLKGAWVSGVFVDSADSVASKNAIEVLPNTTYYSTTYIYVCEYDGNGTFIQRTSTDHLFTTTANTRYIQFNTQSAYGTAYKNDICINLSDPSRNGIYVPYRRYVELNGINDVIDTVTVEKNVTLPFGLVDLGELTWSAASTSESGVYLMKATPTGIKNVDAGSVPNILCAKYSTKTGNQVYIKTVGVGMDGTAISIYDPSYNTSSSASDFKAAMKGIYLYYELADHPLNGTPILAGSYVKRAGTVDMGTLDWNYNSDRQAFYATISDAVDYTSSNVLCAKYQAVQMFVIWTGAQDKVCSMQNNYIGPSYNKRIVVRDTSYTDATTFKASVQGATLCYELATPVETTLTAQQCAEILNGAFTKSKYSTLLTDNKNGQIDQTVDVGMWEQK